MLGHMVLKSMWSVLILAGAVSTFVACTGVSQNEFDRVSSDLDNARRDQIQLGIDLSMSENRITELHHNLEDISADLIKSQSEVADLTSKLEDKSGDLDTAKTTISEYSKVVDVDFPNLRYRANQASLVIGIVNVFLQVRLSGSDPDLETSLNLLSKINGIEDDEIREMWELIMKSGDTLSDEQSGEIIWTMLTKVEESLK